MAYTVVQPVVAALTKQPLLPPTWVSAPVEEFREKTASAFEV